jgi:hypothetical protein
LHERHAVATWNLGTISAFSLRTEENEENCAVLRDLKHTLKKKHNTSPKQGSTG